MISSLLRIHCTLFFFILLYIVLPRAISVSFRRHGAVPKYGYYISNCDTFSVQ